MTATIAIVHKNRATVAADTQGTGGAYTVESHKIAECGDSWLAVSSGSPTIRLMLELALADTPKPPQSLDASFILKHIVGPLRSMYKEWGYEDHALDMGGNAIVVAPDAAIVLHDDFTFRVTPIVAGHPTILCDGSARPSVRGTAEALFAHSPLDDLEIAEASIRAAVACDNTCGGVVESAQISK